FSYIFEGGDDLYLFIPVILSILPLIVRVLVSFHLFYSSFPATFHGFDKLPVRSFLLPVQRVQTQVFRWFLPVWLFVFPFYVARFAATFLLCNSAFSHLAFQRLLLLIAAVFLFLLLLVFSLYNNHNHLNKA